MAATFQIQSRFHYRFHPRLQVLTAFDLNFSSEREQTSFANTELEGRGLYMRQAELEYRPWDAIRLSAGAIPQGCCYLSELVISPYHAFPGLTQSLTVPISRDWSLEVKAQQSIPTSRSQSSQRLEKEPLPYFLTESLALNWSATEDLQLQSYVTHYQFVDMPSRVAFISGQRGNDLPAGATPASARFAYGFNGLVWGLSSQWRLAPRFELQAGLESVHNLSAPTSFGRGELVRGGGKVDFASFEITPEVFVFYNESDTTVSAYNSGSLGHNNRKGVGLDLGLSFKNLGFSLKGSYVRSDLINQQDSSFGRSLQVPQQYFFIKLETHHADI